MKGKRGFAKGISGNASGRPKGSGNKLSRELRERISDLLKKDFSKIEKDLHSMHGKDRVKLYIDLAHFVIPHLQSVEVTELEAFTEKQLDQIISRLHEQQANEEN